MWQRGLPGRLVNIFAAMVASCTCFDCFASLRALPPSTACPAPLRFCACPSVAQTTGHALPVACSILPPMCVSLLPTILPSILLRSGALHPRLDTCAPRPLLSLCIPPLFPFHSSPLPPPPPKKNNHNPFVSCLLHHHHELARGCIFVHINMGRQCNQPRSK